MESIYSRSAQEMRAKMRSLQLTYFVDLLVAMRMPLDTLTLLVKLYRYNAIVCEVAETTPVS